jgi:transposase
MVGWRYDYLRTSSDGRLHPPRAARRPDDLGGRRQAVQEAGPPRRDDRVLVNGLNWLARTGAQGTALPARYGPKSTLHDRFQECVARGMFVQLLAVLLEAYNGQIGLDWLWQAADGCLVKEPLGKRGRSVGRKRPGAIPPTGARAAPSAAC